MAARSVALATTRIENVIPASLDSEALWGASIDSPKPDSETTERFVDVIGWVRGRRSQAVAIEIVHAGHVCQLVPVNEQSADICGFAARIQPPGIGRLQLDVRAVLRDQSRVPLAAIRLARRWSDNVQPPACGLVSIVVTCFNQAHYVREAIESVLAQTYPNFELIVIDDGSGDNTAEEAARYPGVRYVRQHNQGLAAARNKGIAESRGDYLVFLDSDDRLMTSALETGLRQLAQHPECAFVAGGHRMIGFDGAVLWEHTVGPEEDDLYRSLLRRNFIAMHAAVMYQRFVLEAIGGFDPRPRSTEDYDLYLRIARRHPIWSYNAIVAEYRRHGSNMTGDAAVVLK